METNERDNGRSMTIKPFRNSTKDHESNITRYRIAAGLKVKELADRIGCSKFELSMLINGMHAPFYTQNRKNGKMGEVKPYVKRMADVLHATLGELFPRYICDIDRHREKPDGLLRSQMEGISISQSENEDAEPLRHAINKVMMELPARTRVILYKRFYDGMTLQEIGDEYGLSKNRIREIEAKALRQLRHSVMSRELEQYVANG